MPYIKSQILCIALLWPSTDKILSHYCLQGLHGDSDNETRLLLIYCIYCKPGSDYHLSFGFVILPLGELYYFQLLRDSKTSL